MKKGIVFLIALILGVGLGIFARGYYVSNSPEVEVGTLELERVFDLSISYGSDDVDFYRGLEFGEGETLFDATTKVLGEEGVALEFEDYGDLGMLVTSINGLEGGGGTYWQYWVNGEYAQVGASSYEIQPGDLIEWKYTDEQE